jgi:hypothetical protein
MPVETSWLTQIGLVLLVRPLTRWVAPPRALQSASASPASRAHPERQIHNIQLYDSARRPSSAPPPYEPAAVQTSFVSPSSSGIACPSSETLLSHTGSDSLGSREGEYISELTESDTEGSESTYNSESHLELGIKRPLASDICAVTDTSVAPQTSVSPLMATAGSELPLVMRMRTGEAIWTLGAPLQAMSSRCMAE